MGFEPTTLRDLVDALGTELLETMVGKGQLKKKWMINNISRH